MNIKNMKKTKKDYPNDNKYPNEKLTQKQNKIKKSRNIILTIIKIPSEK